jgi:sensor histidine kinase YesM
MPDDSRIYRSEPFLPTTLLLAIAFPFLYLFRFIELKIQKTVKNIIAKTGLIFLSTGFLPFGCLLVFFFILKNTLNYQQDYLALSQVFLLLMAIASLRALVAYFIFKERNLIIENETKLANLRELKAKAELKSLQSQINPHFLYNSLNSIASLAPVDAQKTQKMAHSLSDLFKYSINRKDKKTSTVHDEVEMVKTYLDIEKIRFGERLQFTVMVDNDLENHKIPLFLIQPLVENAVKHGISRNEGIGKIELQIVKEQNEMKISVRDNGPDFPEGLLSGHGLQTVFDLLRLTYGDNATLNWTNTPLKMITITIPEAI